MSLLPIAASDRCRSGAEVRRGLTAAIRLQTGIVTQLVNKSTGADLHATKMLIDTLKDGREKGRCGTALRARRVSPRATRR